LAPTSPTSGGRWVGIVRLRTTATELIFFIIYEVVVEVVRTLKLSDMAAFIRVRLVFTVFVSGIWEGGNAINT
jgi:hypothetical protein